MLNFWIKRKNQSWLKIAAVTVVGSLLFSAIFPPIAEANKLTSQMEPTLSKSKTNRPVRQFPSDHASRLRPTISPFDSAQGGLGGAGSGQVQRRQGLSHVDLTIQRATESLELGTDLGINPQKFFQALDQYVERLENLKAETKDKEIEEQIVKIIKEIKKNLSFSEPFVKNDKEYKIGVYQGEKKKVEFIVQNTMRNMDQLMAGLGNLRILLSTLRLESPLPEERRVQQALPITNKTNFFNWREVKKEFAQFLDHLETRSDGDIQNKIIHKLHGIIRNHSPLQGTVRTRVEDKPAVSKARAHGQYPRRTRKIVRDKQFLHGAPYRFGAIRYLILKDRYGERSEKFKTAVTETEPIWETKVFPLIGFLLIGAGLVLGDWDLVKTGLVWATGFFALAHPLYSFSVLTVKWIVKAKKSGENWQSKLAELREETINFIKETIQNSLSPFRLELIVLAITAEGERGIHYKKARTSDFKIRVTQPLEPLPQAFFSLQTIKVILISLKTVVKILIIDLPALSILSFFFLAPYLVPLAPIFAFSFVPDLSLRIVLMLIFFKPILYLVKIATFSSIKLHQKYNLWVYENNLPLPYANISQGLLKTGVGVGAGENLEDNLREHAALALAEVKKSLKRHYKKIEENARRREQGLYITMDLAGKQELLKSPPRGIHEIIKYLEKKGHPESLNRLQVLIQASLDQNDFSKYTDYLQTMDRYLPLVYWMNLLRRLKPMMEMPELVDLAYSLEVLPQSVPFLSLPEDALPLETESGDGDDEVGNIEELKANKKRRIEELNHHWEEIKQEAESGSSKIFKELAKIFYEKKEDREQASEIAASLFRWGASVNTIFATLLHKHFPEESSVNAKQIEDLLNAHFKEKALSLTQEKLPGKISNKIKELLQSKVTLAEGKKEEDVILELASDLVQEKPVKSRKRISGLFEKHGIQFKDERSKEEISESIKRLINREIKGVEFFELKDEDLNEIAERLNRLRFVHHIPYDFPIDVKGPSNALMNQIDLSLKAAGDPESLLLVLADRLYALETAPEEESERITSNIQMQIRLIWSTIADRVLREGIASEMLTASTIKIVGKDDYEKFLRVMQVAEPLVIKKNIEDYLKEQKIPYIQVLVRPKGAPQTINKVIRKGGLPSDHGKGILVSDLLGIAIVFPSDVASPYSVGDLDVEPLKNRLKSDIAINNLVLERLGLSRDQAQTLTENELLDGFNAILKMADFHSLINPKDIALSQEISQLFDKARNLSANGESLDEQELLTLNQALLQALFPQEIVKSPLDKAWSRGKYKINLREDRKSPGVKEWKQILDPDQTHIGLAVDKNRAWEVKRKEKKDGKFVYTNIKFGGIEIKLMTLPDFLRGESGENAHWHYKLLQRLEEIKMELRTRQEFNYAGVPLTENFKSNFEVVLQSLENKDFFLYYDERTGSVWPIDRNSLSSEDPLKRSNAQLYFTKPEMNLQPNSHLYNLNQRMKDLKIEEPIEVTNYNIAYDKSSEHYRLKLVIKVRYSIPGILHQIAGISWSCGNIVDIHSKTTNQGEEIITLLLTGERMPGVQNMQAVILEMIRNLEDIKVTQEEWLKYRALNKQKGKLKFIAIDRNGLIYDITERTGAVGVNVKGLGFTSIIEKSVANPGEDEGESEIEESEDHEKIEREDLVFRIRMKMTRSGLRKASGEKLQFSMDLEIPEGVEIKSLERAIMALPGVELAQIELKDQVLSGVRDSDTGITEGGKALGFPGTKAAAVNPKVTRPLSASSPGTNKKTQPLLSNLGTQPLTSHFEDLVGGKRDVNLVLEGGGVRGLAHIGAIQALEKQGFTFKAFAGTSVGAIGAAFLAVGYTGKQLERIMRETDPRVFTDGKPRPNWLTGLLSKLKLSTQSGVYEGKHFEDWVRNILLEKYMESTGQIKDPTFKDLLDQGIDLNIVATDLTARDRFIFNAKNSPELEVYKAVRASASFPYFYRPPTIRINGDLHYFSDGGIVSNRPVDIFKGEEEDTIILGLSNDDLVDEVAKIFLGDSHWMVKLNDTGSTILDMLAARVKSHDLASQRQSGNWNEIYIQTQDVSIMEVDLNERKRQELIQRGREAIPESFRLQFERKKIKKGDAVAIENTFKMIAQELESKNPRAIQFLQSIAKDLGDVLRSFVDGYSNPDKEFKNNIYLFCGEENRAFGQMREEDLLVRGVQNAMVPKNIKVERVYENKDNRLLAFLPEQQGVIHIALRIDHQEIEIALLDQNDFLSDKDFSGRKKILWSEIEKEILKKQFKNSEAARNFIYYLLAQESDSLIGELAKSRGTSPNKIKDQIHHLRVAWSGHVKSKRKVFSHNIRYFRPQDFEEPSYVQEGGVDLSSKLSGVLKDSYGFNAIISIEVMNSLLAEVMGYKKNRATKKVARDATFLKIGFQGIGAAMLGRSVGRRDHYIGELGHRIIWGRKQNRSFGYELRLPSRGRAYPEVNQGEERLEQRLSMQAIASRYLDFIQGGSLKDSKDPIVTSLHQGGAEHLIWMLLQGDFASEAKIVFNSVLPSVRGDNDEIGLPVTDTYQNLSFEIVQTVVSIYPKFVPYFLNAFFEKTFSRLRMKAIALPGSAQKIVRQLRNEFAMELKYYPTFGMKSVWPVVMDQYWVGKKNSDSYHYYLAFLTRLMIGEKEQAFFLFSKKLLMGLASLDRKFREKMIEALAARELMLHALMKYGMSFEDAHKQIEEFAALLETEEQYRIKSEIKLWEGTRNKRMDLEIKLMRFLSDERVGLSRDQAWEAVNHFTFTAQNELLFFAEKEIAQYEEIMDTVVPRNDSEAKELREILKSIEKRYKDASYYKKMKEKSVPGNITEAKNFEKVLQELDEDFRLAQDLFSNALSSDPKEFEWNKSFPTNFEEYLYFLDYAGRGKFNQENGSILLIEDLYNIAILIDKNPKMYLEFKQIVNKLLPAMRALSRDSMDVKDSIKMVLELKVPKGEDPHSLEPLKELLEAVDAMKEVIEPKKREPLDIRHSYFALAVSATLLLIVPDSILPMIWFVSFLALVISNLMVYLAGDGERVDTDPFWIKIVKLYYPNVEVGIRNSREMGWQLAYYDPLKNRVTINQGWVRGFKNRTLNLLWNGIRILVLPWMLTQEGGRIWLNQNQITLSLPRILKDFLLYFLKPIQYFYGTIKLASLISRFSLFKNVFGKEVNVVENDIKSIIAQVSNGLGLAYDQIPVEVLNSDWVQRVQDKVKGQNLRIVISVFDLPLLADKLNEFIQSFEKFEFENKKGLIRSQRKKIELALVRDGKRVSRQEAETLLKKYGISSQTVKIKHFEQELFNGKFNYQMLVEENGLADELRDLVLFRAASKDWEGWWDMDSLKIGWDILFKADGKELAGLLKQLIGYSSMDISKISQMKLRESFTELSEQIGKAKIDLELYHVQQ